MTNASNDAVSWMTLLGRPVTLAKGGNLAGASLVEDSQSVPQEPGKGELQDADVHRKRHP